MDTEDTLSDLKDKSQWMFSFLSPGFFFSPHVEWWVRVCKTEFSFRPAATLLQLHAFGISFSAVSLNATNASLLALYYLLPFFFTLWRGTESCKAGSECEAQGKTHCEGCERRPRHRAPFCSQVTALIEIPKLWCFRDIVYLSYSFLCNENMI